jgi:hypothetical protein
VREAKFEYSSRESAGWVLRAEVLLTRAAIRYSIEAEEFNFACLGERVNGDLAANFCLLLQDFIGFVPHATLNRGAVSIGSGPAGLVGYPNVSFFQQEISWLLWQMFGQSPSK